MSKEELRRVFLPRFLTGARQRLERARAGDHSQAAAELHSLAGEAMLLGLTELSQLAVEGERASRACFQSADEAGRQRCADILAQLVTGVEELTRALPKEDRGTGS
jgi:HPt (histidine-containing phosphotransfer) domain-containing protein